LPAGQTLRPSCYFSLSDCTNLCPELTFNCHTFGDWCVDGGVVDDAGPIIVECVGCAAGVGRRPAGLFAARIAHVSTPIGAHFAAVAHLESASVRAFEILEHELRDNGAPTELVLSAQRSRREEVEHARATARIARAHGARPSRARVERRRPRSLSDIALENAVEGCVRETFGALVATFQADHARDPEIAVTMKTIAADETRHAALAWATAKWLDPQLSDDARAQISVAAREAVRTLARECDLEPHEDLVTHAGLPRASTQRTMLRHIEGALFS
jgi:hypothetical protein